MAKEKLNALGIQQTPIQVKLKGNIRIGKKFFEEGVSEAGKPYKKLTFGIETEKDNIVYIEMFAMKNDAYAYSKTDKVSEKVPFDKIASYKKEGYEIIGKKAKFDGKEVNLVDWYLIDYLKDSLKEGNAVFVLAEQSFRKYESNGETKTQKSLELKAIYESEGVDFVEKLGENIFNTELIFMGIEHDKENAKFDVEAKFIAYKDILDVMFTVRNEKLATALKKGLKPYQAITVSGKIVNKAIKEEIADGENMWGDFVSTTTVTSYVSELLIEGANPASIDKEKYSEKVIDEALSKRVVVDVSKDDFGDFKNGDKKDDPFSDDFPFQN